MLASEPPVVARLEGSKAARFAAETMLIPSPLQMWEAIQTIPAGSSKSLLKLRKELAQTSGADVTCPRAAFLCWQLVAQASDEPGGEVAPWWRLTKEGKPEKRLPGGEERHRALLAAEGVAI